MAGTEKTDTLPLWMASDESDPDDDIVDQDTVRWIGEQAKKARLAKGLSPDFGSKSKRRKRLVRNLKRRRSYAKPVKGGTGKQASTRRKHFG